MPNYSIDPNFYKKLNQIWEIIKPFEISLGGPEYSGKASKIPWSGHWWPYKDSQYIANMYDPNGPLEKYDQYVTKVTGQTSNAVKDEKTWGAGPDPHYRPWPGYNDDGWAGHCNGLAAAAVMEPEPKNPKTRQGIKFTVGDQKGLLTEAYFYCYSNLFQPITGHLLKAHIFHKTLIDWLGKGKAVIIDVSCDVSSLAKDRVVNNHPVAAYKMQYETDAADPSKIHVTCMVWGSNYANKDFVGTETKPCVCWPNDYGKTYHYWITGDISDPTDGGWEKGSETDHPDMIWHPSFPNVYESTVQTKWVSDIVS